MLETVLLDVFRDPGFVKQDLFETLVAVEELVTDRRSEALVLANRDAKNLGNQASRKLPFYLAVSML